MNLDVNLNVDPSGMLTPLQADLLHAAFLRQPQARAAWERFRDGIDWDRELDGDSFALLPTAYRNLHRLGVEDPLFARLKGIARQAWLANQTWLARLEPTFGALGRCGIEPLVLPPASWLLFDRAAVLPPRSALRLAVQPPQAEPAIRCLWSCGWLNPALALPRAWLTGYVQGSRHLRLRSEQGDELVLLWDLQSWLDAGSFSRAHTLPMGRHTLRALAPTDAFEYTLRQPLLPNPARALGEVLKLLAATEGELDWPRLTHALAARPLASEWKSALVWLTPMLRQWAVPCEPSVWCAPAADTSARSPAPRSLLARYRQDWNRYRRSWGEGYELLPALAQLPGYLFGRWQLSHPRELATGLLGWLKR